MKNKISLKKDIATPDSFFGIDHYTKSNTEICLIGKKGNIEIKSNKVSSVIISPLDGHSKKPSVVRNKIIELLGDLPRIELFARQKIEGWDVWGNEISIDEPKLFKPITIF